MQTIDILLQSSPLARIDSRLLLQHVLQVNHAWLIAHADEEVTEQQASIFSALQARRLQGEPIAYLLGQREFYGLPFQVNPAVLIPRPETELLVDLALARIPRHTPSCVLDLGTGSGAIAVAIAKHRPNAKVYATDQSASALTVAQHNATLHKVNVHFAVGNWFAAVVNQQFDLIVTNPPYIRDNDPHLMQGDLVFEPRSALTDHSTDGLHAIRHIIKQAPAYLQPNGALLLEHGYDQAIACRGLLSQHGFVQVKSVDDLAGIARVSMGVYSFC